MAWTSVSTVSQERICLNPGSASAISVTDTLAGDYSPGDVVAWTPATKVWTHVDSDVAATLSTAIGVVGFTKRVNQSTGALKDIDTAYDTSETEDKRVKIWISGICIARITDQGADAGAGDHLSPSATAGSLALGDNTVDAVASLAANYADDDTLCIIGFGKDFGMRWGGVNP